MAASAIFGSGRKLAPCFRSNIVFAFAAFWVHFCLLGVLRSYSVVFSALVDVFGINRQEAAWPHGVFGFFMSITGVGAGLATHYFSIRSLAIFGTILAAFSVSICSIAYRMIFINLFYGALQGIGVGIIVPVMHVFLNQNFSTYRAFAMGIAYSGTSAGSFVFPPISTYLLDEYGLDGTFLLLGGIMLNALLGAFFFKAPSGCKPGGEELGKLAAESTVAAVCQNKEKSEEFHVTHITCDKSIENAKQLEDPESEEAISLVIKNCADPEVKSPSASLCTSICEKEIVVQSFEILLSPKFQIITLAYMVYFSSSAIFYMVAMDFGKDRGLEEHVSVFLVSAFSFGDLAGRLTFGFIADLKLLQRGTLVRLYLIAMGGLLALIPVVPDGLLSTLSVAVGVLNGGVIVNFSVLLTEGLGIKKLPMAIGFATCLHGLSGFLRPFIIGYFRDYHQSYDLLFLFLGLLQISMATLWFLETIIPALRQYFRVNEIVK